MPCYDTDPGWSDKALLIDSGLPFSDADNTLLLNTEEPTSRSVLADAMVGFSALLSASSGLGDDSDRNTGAREEWKSLMDFDSV